MTKVREEDLKRIEFWKLRGLLRPVNKDTLQGLCREGLIFFGCGDGDQSMDAYVEHLMAQMACTRRVHMHTMNGGALLLEESAPIPAAYHAPKVMREHVLFSEDKKKIKTLLLYSHYPCGMADFAGIDLPSTIEYTLKAANRLVQYGWDRHQIVPLFHVDHNGDKKRTYFIREGDMTFLRDPLPV